MKLLSAIATLCLALPLLCSCRHLPMANTSEVVAMSKVIDASQPDHDMCSSLAMSKAQVVSYFTLADMVDADEFHDQAVILPCKYEGSIRLGGQLYRWEIYAGGAGYLYDGKAVNKRYLCGKRCLQALPNLQ
ncbi:MAG TPA: hypothetical protein VN043_05825 [Rhodanobacter sp.]|nr:hypothetical protein [Rhodanobacter sp.]